MRPHRSERVASVIHEIVSDALARRINDPRLAPLTTISRVAVSRDLSVATIYLTVIGDATVERRTVAALHNATGFVRRLVAEQLEVRQCPEIRFQIDESAKRIRETMRLLDENRRREPHLYEDIPVSEEADEAQTEDIGPNGEEDDVSATECDVDPPQEGGE